MVLENKTPAEMAGITADDKKVENDYSKCQSKQGFITRLLFS